jgi:hypothetical protein
LSKAKATEFNPRILFLVYEGISSIKVVEETEKSRFLESWSMEKIINSSLDSLSKVLIPNKVYKS